MKQASGPGNSAIAGCAGARTARITSGNHTSLHIRSGGCSDRAVAHRLVSTDCFITDTGLPHFPRWGPHPLWALGTGAARSADVADRVRQRVVSGLEDVGDRGGHDVATADGPQLVRFERAHGGWQGRAAADNVSSARIAVRRSSVSVSPATVHLVSGPAGSPSNPAIAHDSEHSAARPTLGPACESVEAHAQHHDARTRCLDLRM